MKNVVHHPGTSRFAARLAQTPRAFQPVVLAALGAALVFGTAGCNGCNSASTTPAPIMNGQDAANMNGADPADQNFAQGASGYTTQPTRVLGQTASYNGQQTGENYAPQDADYAYNQDPGYDEGGQYIDADQAPPPLPEYEQPEAPDPNDIWTPGYWAYDNGSGYYWVPGAWVAAPYYGALWTPPYWGWYGGHYRFHRGYWGPHVGFYGGIDYGFGYIGVGYFGGYWSGNNFYYNRYVNHVPGGWGGRVYDRPVVYNNVRYNMQPTVRVSFNGGRGGVEARPRPFEVAAMHERHEAPVAAQMQMHQAAQQNRAQFFNQNHGRPAEFAQPHAVGNVRDIRATPAGVQPGRPGFNGNNNGVHSNQPENRPGMREGQMENRPGQPENRPGMQPGQPAQPGFHGAENRPGMQPGQPQGNFHGGNEMRPGQPAMNPGAQPNNNNVRANHGMEMQERGQQPGQPAPQHMNQPAPNMQHAPQGQPQHNMPPSAPPHAEAPRPQPTPQQHMEQPRPQPQQHMEQPRPQPQPQHMEQPHPQPAPQPQHMEAPHAAPAPAPHAEAPHAAAPPAGGGGHPGGGGGGGGHEGGHH